MAALNDAGEPKTIRELYIYVQGRFDNLDRQLKTVWWIGGLSGSVVAGVVLGIFKLAGG